MGASIASEEAIFSRIQITQKGQCRHDVLWVEVCSDTDGHLTKKLGCWQSTAVNDRLQCQW